MLKALKVDGLFYHNAAVVETGGVHLRLTPTGRGPAARRAVESGSICTSDRSRSRRRRKNRRRSRRSEEIADPRPSPAATNPPFVGERGVVSNGTRERPAFSVRRGDDHPASSSAEAVTARPTWRAARRGAGRELNAVLDLLLEEHLVDERFGSFPITLSFGPWADEERHDNGRYL